MPIDRAPGEPWYAGGLRFGCQPGCGACCRNHGDYQYVYLEERDVEGLRSFLGLDRETFLRRYTETEREWVVLRMDRPDCPFLDGTRCGVHPVRPVQCRTFPFWGEHLASPRAWRRLGRFCPGVGEGETHDAAAIERQLAERGTER